MFIRSRFLQKAWAAWCSPLATIVTFSLLLFVLFGTGLALALASATWVAHLRPAPLPAQRVTDAVERAATSQVTAALPSAAVALAVMVGMTLVFASLGDSSMLSAAIAPVIGAVAALPICYYASRRLVRAAGQLVGARSADTVTSLAGKSALGGALISSSGAGALVAGTYSLTSRFLPVQEAALLCFLVSAGASITLAVVARSLVVAWGASEEGAMDVGGQDNQQSIHAGSLACLVGSSFGGALLRSSSLFVLTALSQSALFALTISSTPVEAAVGRFAQLLGPLGLLALLFGTAALRSSEREPARWAWLRSGIVSTVVLIGGTWSLSASITDEALGRLIPSGATFFLVGVSIAMSVAGLRRTADDRVSYAGQAALLGALTLLALLPVALVVAHAGSGDPTAAAPSGTIVATLLGTIAAALPIVGLWQMGDDVLCSAGRAEILANEGDPSQQVLAELRTNAAPDPRHLMAAVALLSLATLCAIALAGPGGVGSLQVASVSTAPQRLALTSTSTLVLASGVLLGLLLAIGSTEHNRLAGARGAEGLRRLSLDQPQADPNSAASSTATPSLTQALETALHAGLARQWTWLALLAIPTIAIPLLSYGSSTPGQALLLPGFLVGLVLTSTLVSWHLDGMGNERQRNSARPHGRLAPPIAVALVTWMLAAAALVSRAPVVGQTSTASAGIALPANSVSPDAAPAPPLPSSPQELSPTAATAESAAPAQP